MLLLLLLAPLIVKPLAIGQIAIDTYPKIQQTLQETGDQTIEKLVDGFRADVREILHTKLSWIPPQFGLRDKFVSFAETRLIVQWANNFKERLKADIMPKITVTVATLFKELQRLDGLIDVSMEKIRNRFRVEFGGNRVKKVKTLTHENGDQNVGTFRK